MGADWQPLVQEEPQTQPAVKEVETVELAPPAYTVLTAPVEAAQPQRQPWWHFGVSCLGTTFCHCFGLAGTLLLCPTSRGKAGATAGFAFNTLKLAVVACIALVLVSHHTEGRFYPDQYATEEACTEAQGVWGVPEQFHHKEHERHHGHHRHWLFRKASSSSSSSSEESNVDEVLFGAVLRWQKGASNETAPQPRCLCPHLYLPKWEDKEDAIVCLDTRHVFLKWTLWLSGCVVLLSAGVVYYLRRSYQELQPTEVVSVQPEQMVMV